MKVYISYEFLPLEQYANLLSSINQIYRGLSDLYIYESIEYQNAYNVITYPIPLCIEEMHTGNSIEFSIKFDKRAFPDFSFNEKHLEVILPRWMALLVTTGAILSYGLSEYKNFQDATKSTLEKEKLQLEIEKLKNEKSPSVQAIKSAEADFRREIYKPNIVNITVNNVTVLDRDNSNKTVE